MNNLFQTISQFVTGVKQQHGQDFNPEQTAKNMLGGNCQTPKQALDMLLQSGRINQEQYNTFVKML